MGFGVYITDIPWRIARCLPFEDTGSWHKSLASLYHTGAATADVYFHNNRTAAFSAFLNHTQFQWVYNGVSQIPYALDLRYQTYAAWGPLEVSPGYGSDYYGKGFVFKNGNQIVDKFEEWTGWLGML